VRDHKWPPPFLLEYHHLVIKGSHILLMISLLIVDQRNHLLTSNVDDVMHIGLTFLKCRFHSLHALLDDSLNVLLKSF